MTNTSRGNQFSVKRRPSSFSRKIHLAVTALSQRGPTLSTVSVAQGGAMNRSWRDRFQLYRDGTTVWLVGKGDTQAALINIAGLGEADPVAQAAICEAGAAVRRREVGTDT